MGFKRTPFGRRKEKSARQIKKEQKERRIKEIIDFKEGLYFLSNKGAILDTIDIYEGGLAPFFKEVSFQSNKIHILRGNNGQGKSTLLKNIVLSTSYNKLNESAGKLKLGSNDYDIAKFLTGGEDFSQFKNRPEDTLLPHTYNNSLSNVKNNITFYTDFTIDFFRNKNDLFREVIESVEKFSNGERKIIGINDFFHYLKIIQNLEMDRIEESLNLIICMDEPESGLSIELQEEFYKKVKYYLNKIVSDKISLTFFIVSHSFIWKKEKLVEVHNINELKKELSKKEHVKIFI